MDEALTFEACLAKFQELRDLREQAVALNLEATKEEDAELGINPRARARLDRKRAEAERYLERQNAAALGIDLERIHNRTYTLEETTEWSRRQEKRAKSADPGFTDYAQLAFRKYCKKVRGMEGQTLADFEEAKESLIAEIKDDEAKRARFSRRRRFRDDEDVTYINQRNYRFNKKVSRAYDEFTEELRENLERGTAL